MLLSLDTTGTLKELYNFQGMEHDLQHWISNLLMEPSFPWELIQFPTVLTYMLGVRNIIDYPSARQFTQGSLFLLITAVMITMLQNS